MDTKSIICLFLMICVIHAQKINRKKRQAFNKTVMAATPQLSGAGNGWGTAAQGFGMQNLFQQAAGAFMGDQARMESAIAGGTFVRPLGGISFDKTFDTRPPKIIPYGCPMGVRKMRCTGFNACEVGPCRRYPSAQCWINACGGCTPEWWTASFQRVMDCD